MGGRQLSTVSSIPGSAPGPLSRRRFLHVLAAAGAGSAVACSFGVEPEAFVEQERLQSRPSAPTLAITPGLHRLGIGGGRDALLHVPASYRSSVPLPLLVLLHGATGSASNWFGSYAARSDAHRFLMLAPESRSGTWDIVNGPMSVDVQFIDAALEWTFRRCAVDAARMAMAGFSDGASYALSLGLANGDLFGRVVAFSPGFFRVHVARGKPPVWISHGLGDAVLPVNGTSRMIVGQLRVAGYAVDYREFDGGHEVPAAISDGAMAWLAGEWGSR